MDAHNCSSSASFSHYVRISACYVSHTIIAQHSPFLKSGHIIHGGGDLGQIVTSKGEDKQISALFSVRE